MALWSSSCGAVQDGHGQSHQLVFFLLPCQVSKQVQPQTHWNHHLTGHLCKKKINIKSFAHHLATFCSLFLFASVCGAALNDLHYIKTQAAAPTSHCSLCHELQRVKGNKRLVRSCSHSKLKRSHTRTLGAVIPCLKVSLPYFMSLSKNKYIE